MVDLAVQKTAQNCWTLRNQFGDLEAVRVLLSVESPDAYLLASQMMEVAADLRSAHDAIDFVMAMEPVSQDEERSWFFEPRERDPLVPVLTAEQFTSMRALAVARRDAVLLRHAAVREGILAVADQLEAACPAAINYVLG